MTVSGIYSIENRVNRKSYLGSSFDVPDRWRRHKSLLSKNGHHNIHLQRAYNKYGETNFQFVLLEEVPKSHLLLVEQQYLDVCKLLPTFYYNTVYVAGAPMRGRVPWNKGRTGSQVAWNKGKAFSQETRFKMSEAAKKKTGNKNSMFGRVHSKETRMKMSLAWKSRPPISESTRLKLSIAHRKRYENIGT